MMLPFLFLPVTLKKVERMDISDQQEVKFKKVSLDKIVFVSKGYNLRMSLNFNVKINVKLNFKTVASSMLTYYCF